MQPQSTRFCPQCKKTLSRTYFSSSKRRDGCGTYCRHCMRLRYLASKTDCPDCGFRQISPSSTRCRFCAQRLVHETDDSVLVRTCPRCKIRFPKSSFDRAQNGEFYSYCRKCRANKVPQLLHDDPNPSGLCQCGCGGVTTIAKKTSGIGVKGKHYRYIHTHNRIKIDPIANQYVVVDLGYLTPCWMWNRSRNNKGYGVLSYRGKRWLAHRLAYTLKHAEIPHRLVLDHMCNMGKEGCCNPDHVFPTTGSRNTRRQAIRALTIGDISEIRDLCRNHSNRDVLHIFQGRYMDRL